jgi:GNAT superfamily N-acetyltransferase
MRQGAIALTTSPVLANGFAGLATSATGQSAVEVSHACSALNVVPHVRLQAVGSAALRHALRWCRGR